MLRRSALSLALLLAVLIAGGLVVYAQAQTSVTMTEKATQNARRIATPPGLVFTQG